MKNLIAALALTLSGSAALAANVGTFTDIHGTHYATYYGDVETGDSLKLRSVLDMYPEITHVLMSSNGGIADEAPRIGQALSDYSVTAVVSPGQWCLSACAEAFLGAADYIVDGALGFHVSWFPNPTGKPENDVFQFGQAAGTTSTYYYLANGFSAQLPYLVNAFTSSETFLTFFDESQLMEFYARSDEDKINDYLQFKVDVDQEWIDTHIMTPTKILSYLGY